MPQREFWTQQHASEVRWVYRTNPMDPEGDAMLSMFVLDQAGKLMECTTTSVPAMLVHETVDTCLHDSWEAWLFGDRHAGPRALMLAATRMRKQARRLRLVTPR